MGVGNLFRRRTDPNSEQTQQIKQPKFKEEDEQQEQQNSVQHVYIKMKAEVTKHDIHEIAQMKKYMALIQNQTWFIDFRDTQTHYPYILSLIEQCQGVQTLQVVFSSMVFPSQIMVPKYHSLTKLVLSNSSLTSIEFINQMDCPNLRELNLCNNLLTSVRPLRRIRGKLEILNIRLNLLNNLWDNSIAMINFNEEVVGLNFEEIEKPYYGDDVNWIFKLNCRTIVRLELNGKLRIPMKWERMDMIKKKFKGDNGIFCWGPRTRGLPYPY